MKLAEYANRYKSVRVTRTDGVLELTLHTDGGEAKWGITEEGHHAELALVFADIATDPENKVVIMTGTGKNFVATLDTDRRPPEQNLHDMWDRMAREGLAMLEN